MLVLLLVLNLGLDAYGRESISSCSCKFDATEGIAHTLENPDGGGEVVDAASSLQGGGKNLNGGNEIVGEAVVQVTLLVEQVSEMIDDVEIANDGRACIAYKPDVPGAERRVRPYLKLEDILNPVEFLLKSVIRTLVSNSDSKRTSASIDA